MLIGLLINIIFLQLFVSLAPHIKQYNKERWEREQFKLELRTIIEKGFEKIDLSNIEWKESDPDCLLKAYIKRNEEK